MFYTYILERVANPSEFYRGHTNDLKRRLAEHNAGKCSHTSKCRPWKVKFYAAFETLGLAREFEHYLNGGSGHAFAKKHFGLCKARCGAGPSVTWTTPSGRIHLA
jgi:predicted GIY-YIG superfamily endonuclease